MMPRSLKIISGSVVFGVLLTLQGCGGGDDKKPGTTGPPASPTTTDPPTTTGPPTTTTAAPTTTTADKFPKKSNPNGRSTQEMAKHLNQIYFTWKHADTTSALGVVASYTAVPKSFYENLKCHNMEPQNPLGQSGCKKGFADCRLSAVLQNYLIGVNQTPGKTFFTKPLNRNVAFVVNETLVENKLARCSYMFDGSTNNRLNVGCGLGAPSTQCGPTKKNAYNNICPSTGKICTATDHDVLLIQCKGYGAGLEQIPKKHSGDAPCFFPGAAINYHGQGDWTASNQTGLREMIDHRAGVNDLLDSDGTSNTLQWNEVVIDIRLLALQIYENPAATIPAFLYSTNRNLPGGSEGTLKAETHISRCDAMHARDEFQHYNNVQNIPVVAIDVSVDVGQEAKAGAFGTLFVVDEEDQEVCAHPFQPPSSNEDHMEMSI